MHLFQPSPHFNKLSEKATLSRGPGIENINFEKTITNLLPTAKGHLDQERDNLQSTKSTQATEDKDFVPADGIAVKTYENAAKIYHAKPKITTYSDQAGHFPIVHPRETNTSW